MLRSHHITVMLADERRRDLSRVGATLHTSRLPMPSPERTLEDRFLEPAKQENAPAARPLDSAPTRSPIRVWRRGGERPHARPRATAAEHATRELDRV